MSGQHEKPESTAERTKVILGNAGIAIFCVFVAMLALWGIYLTVGTLQ